MVLTASVGFSAVELRLIKIMSGWNEMGLHTETY